jgi:hypothetical protein
MPAMATWLKTFREDHPHSPITSPADLAAKGDRRTFYEPMSVDEYGVPQLTLAGLPLGKPRYEIGDLIVPYWAGSRQVTELWEVVGRPKLANLAAWSWQTDVQLVHRIPGLPIAELGVEPKALGQRIKLRLRDHREALLIAAFGL